MYGPSRPSTSRFRSRMLPNVPRIMTSWWPRRAPYELNSSGGDAVLLEPRPGGSGRVDRAGRRDVVGRDRVAEDGQDAGALDVAQRRRVGREAVEERRPGDVRRGVVPGVAVAGRDRQRPPPVVALEDDGVRPAEQLRIDRFADDGADLGRLRPDVGEEDRLRRRSRSRAARSACRCRPGRRARTRRRAAARRGSWPVRADGSGPRSCGCRTVRPRRPDRSIRSRRRSARRAARSCRCRSCSRSRRARTRASRAASMRPAASR